MNLLYIATWPYTSICYECGITVNTVYAICNPNDTVYTVCEECVGTKNLIMDTWTDCVIYENYPVTFTNIDTLMYWCNLVADLKASKLAKL